MKYRELSIVLQGPAELDGRPVAAISAATARQAFPGAEIIVSCWEADRSSNAANVADKVEMSPDPGPQLHPNGVLNINRQLVSSRAGAAAATRPFVLKARSDLMFKNPRLWLAYQDCRRGFIDQHGREPILITNLTTVNPRHHARYLCLCDWLYLAPRETVIELFSAPPFPNEYLYYALDKREPLLRFNAEQWIATNFLARRGLDLEKITDGHQTDTLMREAHYELLGKFFTMKSFFSLGIRTQKHRIRSFSLDTMYTEKEWLKDIEGKSHLFDGERLMINALYSGIARAGFRLIKAISRA